MAGCHGDPPDRVIYFSDSATAEPVRQAIGPSEIVSVAVYRL
jgi:hypothetical protein